MQISYLNKSKIINNEIKDFVSQNLANEENELLEHKQKRKFTLIGLGAFYIILVFISLFIIT